MSKAKLQAAQGASNSSSSSSFAQGFILGQLTLALILIFLIKFFIFGEPPSADSRAATRAALRRQRTLSHVSSRRRSASDLRRKRSSAAVLPPRSAATATITTDKILDKTYYNVDGHQPESLDWFNVLIAQTIAQLRADALEGDAVLNSLTNVLNGGQRPHFLDEIKVTEISLGDEFPIFSNCRVIPVDEDGQVVKKMPGKKGTSGGGLGESRLQARMDVDLSDVLTLGIETKLVLNYPKPFSAVLPVALAVSVVRFSGTLSLSFTPSQVPSEEPSSTNPSASPTTLTFTFLDDYRLDLSVHSLVGSRARLQDVPKIAQLVEQRIHAWFDERCVEPRFQQIVLPSLWPRKKNVRGGADENSAEEAIISDQETEFPLPNDERGKDRARSRDAKRPSSVNRRASSSPKKRPGNRRQPSRPQKPEELMTEEERLEAAGEEIRAAEEREWSRERRSRERHMNENLRRRATAKDLSVPS